MIQEYSSAKTSIKQIPAGVKIVDKHYGWKENTINLDIGGGKYDLMTEYLFERGVSNYIYDPYNRNIVDNVNTLLDCLNGKSDTVTIFNVLNVIKEPELQLEVLKMAHNALKLNGDVFVRSTYMNQSKVSGVTKSGSFQHYLKHSDYLEIVKQIFPNAILKYGLIWGTKSVKL